MRTIESLWENTEEAARLLSLITHTHGSFLGLLAFSEIPASHVIAQLVIYSALCLKEKQIAFSHPRLSLERATEKASKPPRKK